MLAAWAGCGNYFEPRRKDFAFPNVSKSEGQIMFRNPFRKNVETPAPVTAEDAERAKQYLALHTRLNIDKFLESQTADVLFGSPLGPTDDCLSVDEVSEVVEGELGTSRQIHLAGCADCRRHVELYDSLQKEAWTERAPVTGELNPFGEVEIRPTFIRVPEHGSLYMIMLNKREQPFLAGLVAESVRISGAIDGKGYRVEQLNPKEFGAFEAVKIHFKHDYVLHVPKETGHVCDFVVVTAKAEPFGEITKRSFVRVIDESKFDMSNDFEMMKG